MPRVSAEHRAARREEIIDATIRCVAREGFHKTTMAAVIAESGLSAGAVYGYFKGKDELIRATAERAVGTVTGTLHAVATGPGPVSVAGALGVLLQALEALAAQHDGAFPRVAVQAWAEALRDDQVARLVRAQVESLRSGWREVLERIRRDGGLAADADLDTMAQVVTGMLPGYVLQRLMIGDVDPATYAAALAALTED
jgi:AcrR family transcriptional regulator